MIVPIVGCIIAGCLQDVPVVIGGGDPVVDIILSPRKQKNKPEPACYIEGIFYESCPRRFR